MQLFSFRCSFDCFPTRDRGLCPVGKRKIPLTDLRANTRLISDDGGFKNKKKWGEKKMKNKNERSKALELFILFIKLYPSSLPSWKRNGERGREGTERSERPKFIEKIGSGTLFIAIAVARSEFHFASTVPYSHTPLLHPAIMLFFGSIVQLSYCINARSVNSEKKNYFKATRK